VNPIKSWVIALALAASLVGPARSESIEKKQVTLGVGGKAALHFDHSKIPAEESPPEAKLKRCDWTGPITRIERKSSKRHALGRADARGGHGGPRYAFGCRGTTRLTFPPAQSGESNSQDDNSGRGNMTRLSITLLLASAIAFAWASQPAVHAAPAHVIKGTIVKASAKDLCKGSIAGFIPKEHNKYHWFCTGLQTVKARSSADFSLQCGPKKYDKRKLYGYWVSSSALKLKAVSWDPSYGALFTTFQNTSSTPQKYEAWESCPGAS